MTESTAHKIVIDPTLWRLHSLREFNGDPRCDHEWDPEPTFNTSKIAFRCARCDRIATYDAWND